MMFEPIKELILILLKRKKLFLRIFISLSLLSLIFTLFIRVPSYTSHAKIFINSKTQNLNQSSLLGGLLGSQTGGARDVQILTEIISGNSFFTSLMNSDILIDTDNQLTFKEILEKDLKTKNPQKLYKAFLKEKLKISFDSKKQIMDVGIKSKNRQIAKNSSLLVLNKIENSYTDYKDSLEQNKLDSFEKRISEVNQELIKVEKNLTTFREKNKNFRSSPYLLIEYERLMRDRLIKEETIVTLSAQKELSELELKSNKDLFLILNEPYLPFYKDKPSNTVLFIFLLLVSFSFTATIVVIMNQSKSKWEN
tara:strand:- start:2573 stop:3499 length:927 start_codon:yes stop_codon:yes gene_type:complete